MLKKESMQASTSPIDWQKEGREVEGIRFLPATDPLGRTTPLPLMARYNVFGVPLLVATNASALHRLAEETFGHWGAVDAPSDAAPLRLNLCIQEARSDSSAVPVRPVMRLQEHYFLISAGSNLGFADREGGFATAFLTPALLAEPDKVCDWFIECLGIYLACGRHSATLHAAGVVWDGRCLLLTGSDGAGKSTLAYACLRAGAQLLAEDMVCIERVDSNPSEADNGSSDIRVKTDLALCGWGDSRFLHLLPDAVRFFPELCAMPAIEQLNGETKRKIHVARVRERASISQAEICGVCSLQQTGQADSRLTKADPAHIRHVLTHFKGDPPLNQDAMHAAVDRLLQTRLAHLEVGTNLSLAVDMLYRWQRGELDQ